MIKLLALVLLAVSVMPSPADARKRGYYESRHRQVHHRVRHNHIVYEPNRGSLVASAMAQDNMEPFSKQEEIKYTRDISSYLTPEVLLLFPDPPASRVTDTTDPTLVMLSNSLSVEEPPSLGALGYTLVIMGFIGVLMGCYDELVKLRTCHKRRGLPLFRYANAPRWARLKVRAILKDLPRLR